MPVTVHVPESAAEAAEALRGGAVVLAGGTALMPRLNTEAHEVEALVSLRRAGLADIDVDGGVATIGAATTLAQIGRDDRLAFLRGAIESIASPTIRNMATVGGNLFVDQPYGDLAVCLLALDARTGERDGLVTRVSFRVPEDGAWFYRKAMRRRMSSAAIVTVAAVVSRRDGVVESARVALGGAGPRPVRARAAEAALTGGPLDRERAEAAGAAALEDAAPFTDAYASAWYRARVLPVHVRRALLREP